MTAVIEFMTVDLIPFVCAPPSRETRAFVGDTSGEVSVRFLCPGDDIDDSVLLVVLLFVFVYRQRIAGAFYDFIWVGIVE